MSDEVDRQVFDEAARELIRKKLTRYMEENRIGVPTLAKRITDTNLEHEIQITTLQRFLTTKPGLAK